MTALKKEKVLIRAVPDYDQAFIQSVIRDGLEHFDIKTNTAGRITVKPNVVMAHHRIAPSAYTRPELVGALINVLSENIRETGVITVAEKCGTGIPTSRMFRRAGYYRFRKNRKVKILPIEESKKRTVQLRKGKIHRQLRTAEEIIESDILIQTPKLKSNVLSQGITASIKLNVGLLLDRDRMWQHNHNLEEKVVDLLEVGFPDFIITDAVEIAVGGNQLTQHGFLLGAVIMAVNPVAHDVVCAHILNLNPLKIKHLRIANERGYGPLHLSEIDIHGDISLEELQKKTKSLDLGYIKVSDVDCNFRILSGEPYCTGGCHGVFLDWLYMIKDRQPKLWKKLPEWTVIIGRIKGDVSADRVMIIGSCSRVEGKLKAKKKVKIKGCPPRHKDFVLWLFLKAGILNPLFRLDLIIDSYFFLFLSWCKRLLKGRL